MKNVLKKRRFTIFGLLISFISFILYPCSVVLSFIEECEYPEESVWFALLILSSVLVPIALLLYFIDTFDRSQYIIIAKRIKIDHFPKKRINWVILFGFLMWCIFGGMVNFLSAICHVYHFVVFCLMFSDLLHTPKTEPIKKKLFVLSAKEEADFIPKQKVDLSPKQEYLGFWSDITTEPNQREICMQSIAATINYFLNSEKEEIYFGFDEKDLDELLMRVDVTKCELIKLRPGEFIKKLCV